LLAAVLRLWRLNDNGYGNQYYAAGVRSMLENWHNFFFDAFDPNGFVSLDKPPAAFWILSCHRMCWRKWLRAGSCGS
jgi:4-amino-4-deoxy-L-arabinose transferase-like glycosyltransferase